MSLLLIANPSHLQRKSGCFLNEEYYFLNKIKDQLVQIRRKMDIKDSSQSFCFKECKPRQVSGDLYHVGLSKQHLSFPAHPFLWESGLEWAIKHSWARSEGKSGVAAMLFVRSGGLSKAAVHLLPSPRICWLCLNIMRKPLGTQLLLPNFLPAESITRIKHRNKGLSLGSEQLAELHEVKSL